MEVIWVTKAVYKGEYQIFLEFNDGVTGIVDLKGRLKGVIFEPLKDIEYFKEFNLNTWTIDWPNGADLAPEFLYRLATENKAIGAER